VATKAIVGKPAQTVVDIIHPQLTRTEKMAFDEKYHVLMNHSESHKIGPLLHQEQLCPTRGHMQPSQSFFAAHFTFSPQ